MQEENIDGLGTSAVVDASFVLAFLLPDERSALATAVFDRNTQGKLKLFSTALLPFEVLNTLLMAFKRKRISLKLGLELVTNFLSFKIGYVSLDYSKVYTLAIKHKLTFYDASYVFVSKKGGLNLLTLDKELLKIS